jgi:hypothetical protein
LKVLLLKNSIQNIDIQLLYSKWLSESNPYFVLKTEQDQNDEDHLPNLSKNNTSTQKKVFTILLYSHKYITNVRLLYQLLCRTSLGKVEEMGGDKLLQENLVLIEKNIHLETKKK